MIVFVQFLYPYNCFLEDGYVDYVLYFFRYTISNRVSSNFVMTLKDVFGGKRVTVHAIRSALCRLNCTYILSSQLIYGNLLYVSINKFPDN